jgi:hypothetical protein
MHFTSTSCFFLCSPSIITFVSKHCFWSHLWTTHRYDAYALNSNNNMYNSIQTELEPAKLNNYCFCFWVLLEIYLSISELDWIGSISKQMHGHSRLGRSKSGGVGGTSFSSSSKSSCSKFVFVLMSAIFRRRGLLLFAPLLYISGMLLYMGSLSFDLVLVQKHRSPPPPGSIYRSPQLFQHLWPFMEADTPNATSLNVVSSLLSLYIINADTP